MPMVRMETFGFNIRNEVRLMGLPIGYILLEYIESSGTQYINTGVIK